VFKIVYFVRKQNSNLEYFQFIIYHVVPRHEKTPKSQRLAKQDRSPHL